MVTVEHWWNQKWGRLARRDVWLRRDGEEWVVQARQGDGDSRVWSRAYEVEADARAMLAGLLERGSEQWTDLTAKDRRLE